MKYNYVPTACRTYIEEIEDEGIEGIRVNDKQLIYFSKCIGTEHIDEIIPLQGEKQPTPKSCSVNHNSQDEMCENMIYWITPAGNHGWCCNVCGEVIQWG